MTSPPQTAAVNPELTESASRLVVELKQLLEGHGVALAFDREAWMNAATELLSREPASDVERVIRFTGASTFWRDRVRNFSYFSIKYGELKRQAIRDGYLRVLDREAQANARQLAAARQSEKSAAAWEQTKRHLAERMRESSWRLWVEPLQAVGELDGAIVVAGRPEEAAWARRRYGSALGDIVRELSDFRGIFICETPPEPKPAPEAERCL